ncbi:MAG: SDR family oxidoreductase [Nostoc sp.]|uniref:SDR family NAD(P)-dependent oxidoreductase n=1 Tax=Nostoc sp. TaxID=1180 RepID=UPI002FEE951E
MSIFAPDALKGKLFLVTGSSSGLGKAAAKMIAECGGQVLASGRNKSRLAACIEAMAGTNHVALPFELSNADEVADWVKSIAGKYGSLSGIFHSAGSELVLPARMIKQSNLEHLLESNFFAAFGIARASSSKGVITDGGSIVFMSSVAGFRGQLGLSAYSAVKSGVDAMVRSLSCELAPRKIRVNSIMAAAVETEMHARLVVASSKEAISDYERKHLLGFGQPEDVANAVLFLLSDASRWVTGTNLVIDGGYMVR